MKALLTSCNRFDLLSQTLNSFIDDIGQEVIIHVHEDSKQINYNITSIESAFENVLIRKTGAVGQHKSIERFLENHLDKYYLHMEEDWFFNNTYDWITTSLDLMKQDEKVIKVLARIDTEHPCTHNWNLRADRNRFFGYLEPWTNEGIEWKGFSWNPGVTRADLLKQFIPFPKFEQDLAEQIWKAGYKVAELKDKVYSHIGSGRSTTHLDPSK